MARHDASALKYPFPKPADARRIAEFEPPIASVAIKVSPTEPRGNHNLLQHRQGAESAIEQLCERGVDGERLHALRAVLDRFAREARPPAPWVRTRFLVASPRSVVACGLPFAVKTTTQVGDVPWVSLLLRAAARYTRFRLLALSPNAVCLFDGDPTGMIEVPRGSLPASLSDALGSQTTEPSPQLHSAGSHGDHPVFHGQRAARRERKRDLERFARAVARGLEALSTADPLPLVLAADVTHRGLLGRYLRRDVGLLEKGIDGNPHNRTVSDLHAAAWRIVEGDRLAAHACLHEELMRCGPDGKTVSGWRSAVRAAAMGRVRRLYLPASSLEMDQDNHIEEFVGGDDEAAPDALAAVVLRRGGEVLVTESPPAAGGATVSAQLW